MICESFLKKDEGRTVFKRPLKMKLPQGLGVKGFPAGGTPPGGWLGLGAEEGRGKLR